MDDLNKIAQLKQQGTTCSQILVSMGLVLEGYGNPDLVASMLALSGYYPGRLAKNKGTPGGIWL